MCGHKKEKYFALAAVRSSAGLRSVGLAPVALAKRYPRITFSGHMSWEAVIPQGDQDICPFRCVDGSLKLPKAVSFEEEFRELVEKTFGRCHDAVARIANDALDSRGAVIIFADPTIIQTEVQRLGKRERRGIALAGKVNLLSRGADFFKSLANIDGALLVDTDGNCHANGVILDGIACSQAEEEKGDIARGARLNSTKTYIIGLRRLYHRPCIGLVVSEDGMFDLL